MGDLKPGAGSALARAALRRVPRAVGRMVIAVRLRFGRVLLAQGWGMTETSPIGVMSKLLSKHAGRSSAPGMRT